MRAECYELGSALTFLLVLNAGAIIVPLFASRVADRIGPRLVVGAAFFAAAAAILLLSLGGATAALMALTFVAGAGTIGAQVLVYGFAANDYPTACRAAGLAWTALPGPVLAEAASDTGSSRPGARSGKPCLLCPLLVYSTPCLLSPEWA